MAVYWGIHGTGPNENVSKLETDRQTKEKREKKSKRAIKKQRTPCFRNNEFPADRK